MLFLFIELCSLNLARFIIILSLLVRIKGQIILYLHVTTVVLNGHIRPNCFHIHSQKPWNKTQAPRKDEPSFEEQVKKLSDQFKLISEKLTYLSPNEQRFVLINNKKKASKQV
jgi:hypothetical protein